MTLADADRRKLEPLLTELAASVEELLLSGLTTASATTRRMLDVSFQEASMMRLLRLGSTLRATNEELGKYLDQSDAFSRKRLCFFLTRCWLLSKGLARALHANDQAAFDRLLRTPTGKPIDRLEVVTLGVARKVVPGSFCAFDFRLAGVHDTGRYVWSCVFPLQAKQDIPPEAFLHLAQKQGFKAQALLDGTTVVLDHVLLNPDDGRLTLGPQSKVTPGAAFGDWRRFLAWSPRRALDRLRAHQAGPLDLDVELQEEVVLSGWKVTGKPVEEDGVLGYPLTAGPTTFHAVATAAEDGKPLRAALEAKRKEPPPLYGLLHYERCRLVLQPLALLGEKGPEYLTMATEKVNLAALLKLIKF